MARKTQYALLAIALAFLAFVWPTVWEVHALQRGKENEQVRINRITGSTYLLTEAGWVLTKQGLSIPWDELRRSKTPLSPDQLQKFAVDKSRNYTWIGDQCLIWVHQQTDKTIWKFELEVWDENDAGVPIKGTRRKYTVVKDILPGYLGVVSEKAKIENLVDEPNAIPGPITVYRTVWTKPKDDLAKLGGHWAEPMPNIVGGPPSFSTHQTYKLVNVYAHRF